MAESKQNVTILLDRLYNLKGEDNVLIRETEEKIEEILAKIANIEETIENARANQAEQEQGLTAFLQQKSLFETAFEGLTDETFSALSRIDVNLEMGTLLSRVQEKSPAFINGLNEAIESIKNNIIGYESEKEAANEELAKLRALLVVHNEQRAQLVSLLEQSLSEEEVERESLTTSFVKKVLVSFGVFTNDEVSKLTKMIIFPEDGLYEYDKGYEERVAKGLIGYVEDEEVTLEPTEVTIVSETPVEEEEEELAPVVNEQQGEEIPLEETEGVPSILNPDGQIKMDLDKVGTIGEDETEEVVIVSETPVEEEETILAPIVGEGTTEETVEEEFEGPAVVLNFQQFEDEDELENILNS